MARTPRLPAAPRQGFKERLTRARVAGDLLGAMNQTPPGRRKAAGRALAATEPQRFAVIVELDRSFPGGTAVARLTLLRAFSRSRGDADPLIAIPPQYRASLPAVSPEDEAALAALFEPGDTLAVEKSMWTDNYVFARLSAATVDRLSAWHAGATTTGVPATGMPAAGVPLIYKIWLDRAIMASVYVSARTVKCDAARASFAADGKGIVWAVADTGIDGTHPHFATLSTLDLPNGLLHKDFTADHASDADSADAARVDTDGHGTHVAGIIAGLTEPGPNGATIRVTSEARDGEGATQPVVETHPGPISGLAPACKLLSLKVLTDHRTGQLSNLIAAIGFVQRSNDNGRNLKIHGLNLSLGYPFDPEWFAAGQSPLCVEVDRLVRSGVSVVAAAGNGGYGTVTAYYGTAERAANLGTIDDPGNADLAITVGSTHRDMPHAYGVSFFSAKGPTSDGRMKPDLVAPGERIVSCALYDAGSRQRNEAPFRIDSGTSMAAPHVSGAVAAFLSVRGEFTGRPELVKQVFVAAATDLKRRPEFQGAGLLDLMRALQAV